ncbi:hypothetical protein ACFQ22_02740 [Lentilactobacillus raoultii]|uniref:Uncharacterized protein n=1 Tax=Lentilactobacillus raoultii TaxID=1987503 RepID=A0ABW3PF65_9LACO|nr:hypothetical protein [Lentilactobacillus raoultii]
MTTIYIDPKKKTDQIVKLSDGSFGVMKPEKQKAGMAYRFNFTSHQHPGFIMTHTPVNGDVENVDSIDGKQSFKIAWRS